MALVPSVRFPVDGGGVVVVGAAEGNLVIAGNWPGRMAEHMGRSRALSRRSPLAGEVV
ncbi:hypothetical protein FG91_00573 [Sphingopyxis sp. LC81]|uniref:hypothetical protein n=1 Tax=Sphingopyxis sp. LC81 TaxID=1502850 RepID=UPI00050E9667|nr:hypothetical protein [Sphingopyxis sp. LC81]KGB56780.1 hypothetical protein FG91_00573 [Sphingopyxis sp. LC81]